LVQRKTDDPGRRSATPSPKSPDSPYDIPAKRLNDRTSQNLEADLKPSDATTTNAENRLRKNAVLLKNSVRNRF
jgi:hypothetical protein